MTYLLPKVNYDDLSFIPPTSSLFFIPQRYVMFRETALAEVN